MIKNRNFTYKRIIVLTIQRLKELETLLLKHCDSIDFIAITKNNAEIQFDSFDELSRFSNFGEDKIISLSLKCRTKKDYGYKISIDFSPKYPYLDNTVRCMYCFSDIDKESIFIADFEKFLDKIAVFHTKYMICEWASFIFFVVLGLYPIVIPINGIAYYQAARGAYPLVVGILLSEGIAMGLYKLCSKYIWKKLFPRAIYSWGEERENYTKLEKLRSNLFWGVLVTTIISVVVGFILK